MAIWHVDTTATGANDGTNEINAWTSIKSAWNAQNAGTILIGDTVKVRGGQTHTRPVAGEAGVWHTFTYPNSLAFLPIRYVVVDENWVESHTLTYTIDNNGGQSILSLDVTDFIHLHGIIFINFTGFALGGGVLSNFHVINRCSFYGGQDHISNSTNVTSWIVSNCRFYNASRYAVFNPLSFKIYNCLFVGCGYVFYMSNTPLFVSNCLFISCPFAIYGGTNSFGMWIIENCIFYGCTKAIRTMIAPTLFSNVYIRKTLFVGCGVALEQPTLTSGGARWTLDNVGYNGNTTDESLSNPLCEVIRYNPAIAIPSPVFVDPLAGNFTLHPSNPYRNIETPIDSLNSDWSGIGIQSPPLSQPAPEIVKAGESYASGALVGEYAGGGESFFCGGGISVGI